MRQSRTQGFTLLEILIALSIFSVMAVISTVALYNVFHTQEAINSESQTLAELQLASIRIKHDIHQLLNRPIRFEKSSIAFTTGGNINPLAIIKQSTLIRVKYVLEKNQLLRLSKPDGLSIDNEKKVRHEIIASNIKSLSFRFIDSKLQAQTTWFPRYLPLAVEMEFESAKFGKISRFFALPQGMNITLDISKLTAKDKDEVIGSCHYQRVISYALGVDCGHRHEFKAANWY